jgi:hypothetical protein
VGTNCFDERRFVAATENTSEEKPTHGMSSMPRVVLVKKAGSGTVSVNVDVGVEGGARHVDVGPTKVFVGGLTVRDSDIKQMFSGCVANVQ